MGSMNFRQGTRNDYGSRATVEGAIAVGAVDTREESGFAIPADPRGQCVMLFAEAALSTFGGTVEFLEVGSVVREDSKLGLIAP